MPVPSGLLRMRQSPGGAGVGHDPLGMHQSGDGEAGLDFRVLDAVSAEHGHARLGHFVHAAAEDLPQGLVGRGVGKPTMDKAVIGRPPMAYTSLSELAAAICPNR